MNFEDELFKKYIPNSEALKRFGFKHERSGIWLYKTEIRAGQFRALVRISKKGAVSISLFDIDSTEYPLIHVESANGEFVTKVRAACVQLLLNIRESCFIEKRYIAEQTGRIVAAIKLRFQEEPDDPWNDLYPGYGVFRNAKNRKWYALLMNIDGTKIDRRKGVIEIINVKADPELIQQRLTQSGYHSAYHMNRVHWISIILDDSLSDEEILSLIVSSRRMTEEKKK